MDPEEKLDKYNRRLEQVNYPFPSSILIEWITIYCLKRLVSSTDPDNITTTLNGEKTKSIAILAGFSFFYRLPARLPCADSGHRSLW